MITVYTFFLLFAVNVMVTYLANIFFPDQVVLGTLAFTPSWALFHSMLVLSLIGTLAVPFFQLWEKRRGKKLTDKDWMLGYFLLNFVAVWGIARFSEQFGLGVRSWLVAAILAVVLDVVQGLVMMQLEKYRSQLTT